MNLNDFSVPMISSFKVQIASIGRPKTPVNFVCVEIRSDTFHYTAIILEIAYNKTLDVNFSQRSVTAFKNTTQKRNGIIEARIQITAVQTAVCVTASLNQLKPF